MLCIQDDRVVMNVNGLKCAFHMPAALLPKFKKNPDGSNGDELVQNLPKGSPRFAFPVDEYPACPTSWMNGSAKASSYWLPARPGCGMWLDFNYNYEHSHHVAVVVSIQGVNPITGQQTKALRLEQYRDKCPVHDLPFGQDRFCEQCGYKWDAQNYISNNNTPRGLFWMDGFRGEDGVVRQYLFTEETCKGVASNIIGEDRVFAIGIAFYLSKEPKTVKPLAPELAAYNEYKGTSSFFSGNLLKGFPPSNTISPSVRITDKDLTSTEKIKVMGENPQLLGVGVTCPDAIPDVRNTPLKTYDAGGPPPTFPPIQFGKAPESLKIEFGDAPTVDVNFPSEIKCSGIPSEIKCSMPTPPPVDVNIPPDVPAGRWAAPSDKNEDCWLPTHPNPQQDLRGSSEHHNAIRLRDSNDFTDLSATINRNSRVYKEIAKGGTLNDTMSDNDIATFKRVSLKGGAAAGNKLKSTSGHSQQMNSDACATTDFDVEYSKTNFAPNESKPSDINSDLRELTPEEVESEMKKLEITAGARIRQRIFQDPEDPEFWQEQPCGMIYINYVDLKTAERILEAGHQRRSGSYLSSLGF
jgi:hypothetical protein